MGTDKKLSKDKSAYMIKSWYIEHWNEKIGDKIDELRLNVFPNDNDCWCLVGKNIV